MAQQLPLDWPAPVAQGAADFFVSGANRAAFEMVSGTTPWPGGKLVLVGPAGAGKSHLARVWSDRTGAEVIAAPALGPASPPPDVPRLVVEDCDRLPPEAETWLFHAHNSLAEAGGHLLLTARSAPSRWPLTLPDLATRMQAATLARIDDPDDDLLAAVLCKHFTDRQIDPDPAVLRYLVRRMERSFRTALRLVDLLDREALARRRPVTRRMAGEILDREGLGDGGDDPERPED